MSNIARVYAPGTEPFLLVGTPAANALKAGTSEQPGAEKAVTDIKNLSKVTDLAK